jgi:hypothetical protein
MSPVVRVITILCGIAAITTGVIQMKRGADEMSGEPDPKVKELTIESDKAVAAGDQFTEEATPLFTTSLADVDKLGLEKSRAQNKAATAQAADLLGKAAEQYRLAGQKLDDAIKRSPDSRLNPFYEARVRAYKNYAEVRALNQEICRLLADETIKIVSDLEPKVTAAAERRDGFEKAAVEAAKEGNKIAVDLKKK